MRYLIGALFGGVLVLLFFGATTYYHYHQSQRLEEGSQKLTNPQRSLSFPISKTTGSKSNARYDNHSRINNQRQPVSSRSSASNQTLTRSERNLYTWKDKNGNKVISSIPPETGNYEKFTLPEKGLSVVEMEKVKPIRFKKDSRTSRRAANANSPSMIKQQLISKNKGKCRWLVGRAYERYTKILEHSGSNQSVHCDEHSERLREMRKLAREGTGCYYPYRAPAKCL